MLMLQITERAADVRRGSREVLTETDGCRRVAAAGVCGLAPSSSPLGDPPTNHRAAAQPIAYQAPGARQRTLDTAALGSLQIATAPTGARTRKLLSMDVGPAHVAK